MLSQDKIVRARLCRRARAVLAQRCLTRHSLRALRSISLRLSVSHQYLYNCDFHLLGHLPHFSDYVTRKMLTDKIISNRCVPRVICVRVYVL